MVTTQRHRFICSNSLHCGEGAGSAEVVLDSHECSVSAGVYSAGFRNEVIPVNHALSLSRRAAALPTLAAQPHTADVISFDSGHAFPGILPDLTEPAERALTRYRTETLQYIERPGLREMREWVAAYMMADGARTAPEEVLMANGAKHALELICRLLLDEGDSVVVTAPTYYTSIPIFRSFGVSFIEVGQDVEGIDVDAIEAAVARLRREGKKAPKLIYDVPDFHNPTAVTMSRRRREALLGLAARHDVYVVEDSPYRKIRFGGESEPSLKALDENQRVLTAGTFSKLIAPGLRVGWVAAPSELITRIAQLKSDGGSSPLLQRTVLEFCKMDGLQAHTRLAQATYCAHRDRMVTALRRDLPEANMTVPDGGYYVWVTLPQEIDGDELAKRGLALGVHVIAGSKFFAGPGFPRNHVRLAYSHATPEEIDEGVKRLARAYASMSDLNRTGLGARARAL